MNFLKWLLCFFLVPVIAILGLGGILLLIYFLFNYYYIMIPLLLIGFWIYAACGLYDDWF